MGIERGEKRKNIINFKDLLLEGLTLEKAEKKKKKRKEERNVRRKLFHYTFPRFSPLAAEELPGC